MVRKLAAFVLFICALSILFGFDLGRVEAQVTPWSNPLQLSAPGAPAWFPDVVSDPSGVTHIVWAGGDTEFDQVLYRAYTPGSAWSPINDLAAFPIVRGESAATRPSLLADDQLLHMTYTNYDGIYYSNAPLQAALAAGTWQEPTVVDGDQTSYFSRLAHDEQGNLHLVYTENTPQTDCQQCYHLYYIRSSDEGQSWTVPVDISIALTGAAKPQIVIGSDGIIHVVWEAGYGGGLGQVRDPTQVFYASSSDNGNAWSTPFELSASTSPSQLARNVAIGIDGNGVLLAVWASQLDEVVYFRTSRDDGRTWSQPQVVPGVYGGWSLYQQRLDDFTLAADSVGNLHFAAVGRRVLEQTGLDLLHSVWNGSGWSSPEVVASYDGDVPEWPRLAVNLGNQLNLVWFVRGAKNLNNSDAGDFSVFYAERIVDAPAIAPLAIEAAPVTNLAIGEAGESIPGVITSSEMSQVDITPRLLEAEPPEDSLQTTLLGQNITSENDEVLLILLSLVPVFLAVGLIVLFRQRNLRSASRR